MTVRVNAVVLAGGDGSVIDAGVRQKGAVPVAGRQMAEWVVETLRQCPSVGRVAVVIPDASELSAGVRACAEIVESDQRFIDNVFLGIDSFGEDLPTLVVTADIPALTVDAIEDFISAAEEGGADFAYPLISEQEMLAQFPGSVRTFVRIKGGTRVTGGNVAYVAPRVVASNREIGQRLFDTRKNPMRMARVVGISFVVRMALGILRPEDVEERMEALVGGRCVTVITPHACLGADIDKPIDREVIEVLLSPFVSV